MESLEKDILKLNTKLPIVLIDSKKSIMDLYFLEDILGKGSFGTVFRGTKFGDPSADPVAIKEIKLEKTNVANLVSEIEVLYSAQFHGCGEYTTQLFDVLYDSNENRLYFVMELLKGMTLNTYLKKHLISTEDEALKIVEPLMIGMNCLHAAGIAHRDIKNDNVMITEGSPKWIDFGLSCIEACRNTHVGNLGHMAPEILGDPGLRVAEQWMVADIWGFGCLVFELITGQMLPFQREMAIMRHKGYDHHDIEDFTLTETPLKYEISSDLAEKLKQFPIIMELLEVCLIVNPVLRELDYKRVYVDGQEESTFSSTESLSDISSPRLKNRKLDFD